MASIIFQARTGLAVRLSVNDQGLTMDKWAPFRKLADLPSAQALVELLLTHKVPARIESPHFLSGIDGYYTVAVPSELLHRASWVSPEMPFDEAELAFLATGQLNAD